MEHFWHGAAVISLTWINSRRTRHPG